MNKLTSTEVRLVEQYLRVLDLVSRCAQAVDGYDWWYLLDKTRQLQYAAEHLTDVAQTHWQAIEQGRRPRRGAIAAAVATGGRHYRAARLLHPTQRQDRA
jgi:3-methyladenine DNA glycosylase AlkD